MLGLMFFPNLKRLTIMQQDIEVIEGLDECVHLEYLWLNENKIKKIEGLENCTKLKELYLYCNQIKKIEGLSTLTNLEVLWLFENNISEIEGLDRLHNLRVLWLAKNNISKIEDSLAPNTRLEELNLAGNNISCFKEIPYLDRLVNLRSLCFSDPNFGDNPVCHLCNYQTYALYHLVHITKLDTMLITDEARQMADATFVKKKMYYNMRIKTLKRNTTSVIRKAQAIKQERIGEINLNLNVLVRVKKELERELEEEQYLPPSDDDSAKRDADTKRQLSNKYEVVKATIDQKYEDIAVIEKNFEDMTKELTQISDHNISRLMVELETGGNIRLEEGKPGDVWFHSCVDLVNSRFFGGDFEPFGIVDLKVNRVTRIHNRYLRNRFEERLDLLVDTRDTSYKRALEYLFYGQDPNLPGEVLRVIESGFRTAQEYEKLGGHEAVPLSNSVSVCEIPRLKLMASKDPRIIESRSEVIKGCLLITKVFLGSFTPESNKRATAPPSSSTHRISQINYKGYNSVYRIKSGDNKQRLWFVFDNALVLPEYLVEFEYIKHDPLRPMVEKEPGSDGDAIIKIMNPKSEQDAMDIRCLASPFCRFSNFCKSYTANTKEGDITDSVSLALGMPPVLQPRNKVLQMSNDVVLATTRAQSLTGITYLNLYGNRIQKIEASLADMVNLKILILSFNELSSMENISDLPNIERIELGFNLIKRVEGLRNVPKLKTLELNNNLLYRIEDISMIKKHIPQLEELNLQNNALCELKSYRYILLRRLTELKVLDGRRVTPKDRIIANEALSVITPSLIYENSSQQRRFGWSLSYSPSKAIPQGENHLHQRSGEPQGELSTDAWMSKVHELDLNRMRLRKVQNLEKLTNLCRASFVDNEISKIEGLDCCTKLEELSYEENRITKIEGLNNLIHLRKLDLGKNKIAKIENLSHLTELTQLSLEDNEITSLNGISKLVNLMELYIGNNKIANVKEVNLLKDLPKLIILDLSGNPMTKDREYRLFTIFQLRKLKVLDGVSIDAAETAKAKETFMGKMSSELLLERVGHNNFKSVVELNLSNCGIKELSHMDQFVSLRELNIDNNYITDLSGIQKLTTLKALYAGHNRIETAPHSKQLPVGRFLEGFNQLEVLHLDFNHIASIASLQLQKLSSLKVLNLRGNEIVKVDGLSDQGGMPCLQELILDKNKIRAIDEKSLVNLPNLRVLRLEENALRSLDGLKNLPSLQVLLFGCNRILDLADLDKILPLAHNLVEVSFAFNPLARKSLYRPTLIYRFPNMRVIDGKEVTQEERDRIQLFFAQDYYSPNVYTDQATMINNANLIAAAAGNLPNGGGATMINLLQQQQMQQQQQLMMAQQQQVVVGPAINIRNAQGVVVGTSATVPAIGGSKVGAGAVKLGAPTLEYLAQQQQLIQAQQGHPTVPLLSIGQGIGQGQVKLVGAAVGGTSMGGSGAGSSGSNKSVPQSQRARPTIPRTQSAEHRKPSANYKISPQHSNFVINNTSSANDILIINNSTSTTTTNSTAAGTLHLGQKLVYKTSNGNVVSSTTTGSFISGNNSGGLSKASSAHMLGSGKSAGAANSNLVGQQQQTIVMSGKVLGGAQQQQQQQSSGTSGGGSVGNNYMMDFVINSGGQPQLQKRSASQQSNNHALPRV